MSINISHTPHTAGAKQPIHWFLGGKGLGIQQGTSAWVGLPKSSTQHPANEMLKFSSTLHDFMPSPLGVNEHQKIHFDNAEDIHMNSKNYEDSVYNLHLNSLTITC